MRIPIAFRLPADTVQLLKALVEQEGMTQTSAIVLAVRAFAKANNVKLERAKPAKNVCKSCGHQTT